ncbi:uncharacterized protein LOC114287309 [Camellia sinensis]|uniref:uncharacterized protein LOC114287309 n=1 Tax=Camellia sinensis TaxID=4442 RepID=UPI001036CE1A|nr:uncharacterized protein LOC114287309 [Camellia sinensis]
MGGQVSLVSSNCPPELDWLYTSNSEEAKEFRTYVRTYNNCFAFTSFGVKYDKELCRRNKGIYTFRIQGQVYHFINELTSSDENLSHLQLYFYDTDHEIQNRMKSSEKLNPVILERLINISHLNPYSIFFRRLEHIDHLNSVQIIIKFDVSLDQRVYNQPSTSQVAAIWSENDVLTKEISRDIVVHQISGHSEKVQWYFGCYDPLQYPLLFPYGESGWHYGIDRVDKNQTKITCHQQSILSVHQALTASDLLFFRNKQREIRADLYQGIIDSVTTGEGRGSKIGHRVILPPSFIGSPRDLRRRYVDAMALVQRFGKPDIFLTMTCNPTWPEIKAELGPNEEAQNRPDLTSRAFRAKMEQLKDDIIKHQIFGKVVVYVYVIEFQKTGLPHMHLLLILAPGQKPLSPDTYDSIVSVELPDQKKHPHLFSMVVKHMMHGPCGEMNPNNICMKNGKCKNHYPKNFEPITRSSKDSYPIYKRRADGNQVKIRRKILDNRWVVSYNPYLLAKYDCHINVEICSTIKAVKYLYKYIYKGHDKIAFHIVQENQSEIIDEIQQFQSARWISPPEAMWRIYAFSLNDIYPSVIHLQIHLEHQQFVTFNPSDDLNSVLNDPIRSKTMLTEFFLMNKSNEKAKLAKYLYKEFPEHFVWWQQDRMWTERKKGNVIGCIVTAHPAQGERCYLRLLLNNIRGPTSFESLRTINGRKAKTFREAALLCGLLQSDNNLEQCLEEAISYQMPYSLRRLFATILIHCAPNNPNQLWEKFKDYMAEDYAKTTNLSKQEIFKKVLQSINSTLQSMGKDIKDFNICSNNVLSSDNQGTCREIEEEMNIVVSEADYQSISLLSSEQKVAFEKILNRVFSGKQGCFFIDGPGGTGKTFLYKALLAAIRSKNYIALATATSGVAASVLPGGRMAYSRFKIPIDVDTYKSCNIGKQTGLANLLRTAKLIIWVEAPMAKKQNIEALNDMLKDINESELLFGGKVVVLGGDFRQIPPVIPKGTKYDSIDASLVNSELWKSIEKIKLTENMRARHDPSFSNYLLRIGNGSESVNDQNKVKIPASMIISNNFSNAENSIKDLIQTIFPNLKNYSKDPISMINSVVLTPKNDCVQEINDLLIKQFPTKGRLYTSIDKTIDPNDQGQYEDFLNSLEPNDVKVLIPPTNQHALDNNTTKNVVYEELLTLAGYILAAVVQIKPPKTITTENGTTIAQEIVLINEELMPIVLTLWGQFVTNEGEILQTIAQSFPTLIAVRLKVSSFHGQSLSTKPTSAFVLNPNFKAAHQLHNWCIQNEEVIRTLPSPLETHVRNITSPSPKVDKIISISNIPSSPNAFRGQAMLQHVITLVNNDDAEPSIITLASKPHQQSVQIEPKAKKELFPSTVGTNVASDISTAAVGTNSASDISAATSVPSTKSL